MQSRAIAPIFGSTERAQFDAEPSIGERYGRTDEAGTPFCFTIDGQTKEDGTVTVRHRDNAPQVPIDNSHATDYLRRLGRSKTKKQKPQSTRSDRTFPRAARVR